MSDHRRHTQRAGRRIREEARTTVRAPRIIQTGGAQPFVIPSPRSEKWNTAFRNHHDVVIKSFADKLDKPYWGQSGANAIVDLYAQLIERQDELSLIAIDIINHELGITPTVDDIETEVTTKIAAAKLSDNGEALKEYLLDIFRIITGGEATKTVTDKTQVVMKHTRLWLEPLSNILMWPKRAKNMFVYSIAKILHHLKHDSSNLTRIKGNIDLYRMFADVYDTFIQREVLFNTSKSLRDGFYIWQLVYSSIIPVDECGDVSFTKCEENDSSKSLWFKFCQYYNDSAIDKNIFLSGTLKLRFSHILAKILHMYMPISAKILRQTFIDEFKSYAGSAVRGSGSKYRIDTLTATTADSNVSKMMRALDPDHYTFILHLLYTLQKVEEEAAAMTASTI